MNKKHYLSRGLVLASLCMMAPIAIWAQTVKFSPQESTLRAVISAIERQSGYSVDYDASDIDVNVAVKAHDIDGNIGSAMEEILAGTGLTCEVKGKHIIIKKADAPRKGRIVTGTILDELGEPVAGATVLAKGTKIGTVTDINGNYSLEVPDDCKVLQYSYIGYTSQDISIDGRRAVNVTMTEDSQLLDDVVVVGYGVQRKVDLTGSVSAITARELENKPVMSTAQALAGVAPGLSVVANSGRPGAGASIKIRGTGTFSSAGNDPLILIDGLAGSIDDVDANDIQSISFLKDAASASIYGNRAANGVILIETKKGVQGKTHVTYSNQFGWQTTNELPEFLESADYATYYNMAMTNMGRAEVYSTDEIQKYRNGSDPDNYPNVNHLKWLLESGSGFQQQHNIGVQGGSGNTTYNLSVGLREQNGLTARTQNRRLTALFTMKSELNNNLTLTFNLNAYRNRYGAPYGSGSIDGIIGYAVRETPVIAGKKSNGTYGYQDDYCPEGWLDSESFVKNYSTNISSSAQLKWTTPIKGLSLTGKAGANYYTSYNKTFKSTEQFDENKSIGPNSLSANSSNNLYTDVEALANYDLKISDHSLNVLLGTSLEETQNKGMNGYRTTFPNNYLYELSSGDASTSTNGSSLTEYTLLSFFGRVNYSFKDRYLLEANVRADGSSRFADGKRWGVFPSVSVGWRISEEAFWKDAAIASWFDNLKIRVSEGVLGNQNIEVYPYQQTYSLGHNYVLGGSLVSGAYSATYKNENVTWERTSIFDVGLDFGMFGGRLNGTVDYFYKYTSDILASVEVATIMGRGVGQSNVGAVSNKGIEIELNWKGRIGKDFEYSIAPNFTYVKNAVEELADGAKEDINNNRIVGEPIGIIYGYETEGLFVNQSEIDSAPEQLVGKSSLKPGYVRYKDLDGDGKVTANEDRKVLGSMTPKFYYGLNLSASYKGLDLSVLFQGLGGHKRLIGSYMAYAFYNGGQIQKWQADGAWTEANPDKWAEYPRIETMNMNHVNAQTSDYWVRNASYLRCKNIQLGYTLPKQVVRKVGIDNVRLFFSGQNLFTFSSFYKGWDPENEIGTGDAPSYYPITRIFSFGMNVKF